MLPKAVWTSCPKCKGEGITGLTRFHNGKKRWNYCPRCEGRGELRLTAREETE